MLSSFTWMDHSEEAQRRVLDAVAVLHESDTQDGLGLGVTRDRYAHPFFPVTGTVHTRARYFLFLTWRYQRVEQKDVNAKKVVARNRKEEIWLRDALLGLESTDGVIEGGGASLKRLPSNIYRQGMGKWGIGQVIDALTPRSPTSDDAAWLGEPGLRSRVSKSQNRLPARIDRGLIARESKNVDQANAKFAQWKLVDAEGAQR